MRAIIRKQRIREGEGKRSSFRVRGREVDPNEPERWQQSHWNASTLLESFSAGEIFIMLNVRAFLNTQYLQTLRRVLAAIPLLWRHPVRLSMPMILLHLQSTL